jgi:hypothetical protein
MNRIQIVCAAVFLCGFTQTELPQGQPARETPAGRELQWRQDLQCLTAGLKAPGYRIAGGVATRGQKDFSTVYPNFDAELDALTNDLANLPDSEVLLRLMRLIASAHIAHNRIQLPAGMGFQSRLALSFHWYADGLAVAAAASEYSNVLGARVLTVGGKTPDQFLKDLTPYVSYENQTELRASAARLMNVQAVLQHFQMIGSDGRVSLRLEKPGGGATSTLSVTLTESRAKQTGLAEVSNVPTPLYASQPHTFYWHKYLPDSQTLYIQYNLCENDRKRPFGDFAHSVLADADANTVRRVVIDLRANGGGDSRVIGPLKSGLATRLKSVGNVYVLIGPATFSSAVLNAVELRKALKATLVGEPSGGMPGGYGEVAQLTLPNSKLVIRYTTRYFGSKNNADPTTLTPDIAAPLKIADVLAGTDPALDAAIRAR